MQHLAVQDGSHLKLATARNAFVVTVFLLIKSGATPDEGLDILSSSNSHTMVVSKLKPKAYVVHQTRCCPAILESGGT